MRATGTTSGRPAEDAPPAGPRSRLTRRAFLAASIAAAGAAAYAWLVEPRSVRFTRHVVRARRSAAQRPFTLVQISDLHLRGVGGLHRRIAREVAALRPDLLLFTGDAVDRPDTLGDLAELLAMFDPALPKYAILGNWEYWGGVDLRALASTYEQAGGRLLVNETAVHERGRRRLAITGLDDLVGGLPGAAAAIGANVEADARVLLAHCPAHRDVLPPLPAPQDLILSGHTHGGQVNLFGWAPTRPPGSGRYVSGWYRDGGAAPLYVSRGIGTSVLPIRFGAPPEVAVFTLWV